MSFRTRLTSFFVVIVVVPMVAIGFLVFRLIGDSAQGKADARANGLATAAAGVYASERAAGTSAARTLAHSIGALAGPQLRSRLGALALQSGLARVRVLAARRVLVDVGDKTAIAPGLAFIRGANRPALSSVEVSTLTATQYARELSPPGVGVVVSQRGRILASTLPGAPAGSKAGKSTVALHGSQYRAVTQRFPSYGGSDYVTVFSNLAATSTGLGADRTVAAAFIAAFLVLALSFSVLASRALGGQLSRFLQAARRLAGGDFSSPVPTEGHDEFAALGSEFNNMSRQLESRLEELSQERTRLRESIKRIGETFAANLDRPALLELALRAAVDAVHAEFGRLSVRSQSDEPLAETVRVGSLNTLADAVFEAERAALLEGEGIGEFSEAEANVIAVALGPLESGGRAHGVITVGAKARAFSDDDREVLRSLASRATLALENVDLHTQVSRQAITDDLTGLVNHGRFHELLRAEMEQVRRYQYPVGLVMLDIDDFKSINDAYGHQQGDIVLKQVAQVLSETSRETDTAARYGGEELALVLPHTDLEGTVSIAERVRTAVESLRIARLDGQGSLRVTASVGVAASTEGDEGALISEADSALYTAKRQGKNRTVQSTAATANVVGGE
ncbi:MAG: diguanylate cyclase [Solirubrobacterales bacterium]|nr:diguanylate cyclase [Solirubrobacterales bacterium]